MLKKLYIKNFALIDEMTVHFNRGLNIITGETGAGKSIVINAINLILGEKAKTDLIRQGYDKAIVEGEFFVDPAFRSSALWDGIDMEDSNCVIIRRELHRQGRTRTFVNDSPASNAILAAMGDTLVDLHGQHEHQALFKTDYHLTCLDNFGVDSHLKTQVGSAFNFFKSTQNDIHQLKEKHALLNEKKDLLEFQVQEIQNVNPQPDEDQVLSKEEKILQNSETLIKTSQLLQQLLYEGEHSVYEKLTEVNQRLNRLSHIDTYFNEFVKSGESAQIISEEIAKGCQTYVDRIDFDPERLETIRERLSQLNRLKKKYGPELKDVLSFLIQISADLNQIENMDNEIQQAEETFQSACHNLSSICEQLSHQRHELALKLEKHIQVLLSELGMVNNQFKIKIEQIPNKTSPICKDNHCFQVSPKGWDKVEFLISLNLGESLKKLKDVASGGEISRIMLALKTVLADADAIPVLIFDEIDSGISGRIARIVGQNLKALAKKHQVICITHLPQIASLGDHHLFVQKITKDDRSTTTIQALQDEERIHEIAKLLGGETITETTIQSAKELIQVEL